MEFFVDKEVKAKRAERARLAAVLADQHAQIKSIEECQAVLARQNQCITPAYTTLSKTADGIRHEMAYIAGEMAETGLLTV